MNILNITFDHINLFTDSLSLDFVATDRVADITQVLPVAKSTFCQRVIAFAGINATGKTTVLRLIVMVMDIILANKGLDSAEIPSGIITDGTCLSVYFHLDDNIYLLKSVIGIRPVLGKNTLPGQTEYFYVDEKLYCKNAREITTKASIFNFSDNQLVISRNSINQREATFLKSQDSIVAKITASDHTFYMDMIWNTDYNIFMPRGQANTAMTQLFDSSIDRIDIDNKKTTIQFKNQSRHIDVDDHYSLSTVLSSGTIKGINILARLKLVLSNGGYLIIDEIEIHLHKKLVQTIIGFFTDHEINKKGAVLIFSTHYSEILDTIDRKDNIYILKKRDDFKLEAIKYADAVKRNDIKKSEVYLSNYMSGTAPSYESIKAVKDMLCQ